MVYQPMLELLAYLRANGFKTFIVSGGGIEFMRPWTEKVYGIPPEQVVGSSGKTKFEMRDGKPVLVKLPEVNFIDDKDGKPVGINQHIGRRPIAAFGNSDGDLQMLQWTGAGSGPRFCLYVHHTDAEREYAYDRKDPHRPARQGPRRSRRQRLDGREHEGRLETFFLGGEEKGGGVLFPPPFFPRSSFKFRSNLKKSTTFNSSCFPRFLRFSGGD